ncbi:MAG: hypothetical protein U9R08_01580 [Nanoarchaeota archaeon]|nr:hypothetical protein [Nanoarchaeota archaeon]
MKNDQFHEIPLKYGKTDEVNFPDMPGNNYFCVGYNQKYGLVDVMEGDGNPVFEGRINIENLLSQNRLEKSQIVDSRVEDFVMSSYRNLREEQKNPYKRVDPSKPVLECLSYKG